MLLSQCSTHLTIYMSRVDQREKLELEVRGLRADGCREYRISTFLVFTSKLANGANPDVDLSLPPCTVVVQDMLSLRPLSMRMERISQWFLGSVSHNIHTLRSLLSQELRYWTLRGRFSCPGCYRWTRSIRRQSLSSRTITVVSFTWCEFSDGTVYQVLNFRGV